jgi:hypothetical protein
LNLKNFCGKSITTTSMSWEKFNIKLSLRKDKAKKISNSFTKTSKE